MNAKKRIYIGASYKDGNGIREIFKSSIHPTAEQFPQYQSCIGPFKTMRGAIFMRDYGFNNPHCQTVNQAEKIVKKRGQMMNRKGNVELYSLEKLRSILPGQFDRKEIILSEDIPGTDFKKQIQFVCVLKGCFEELIFSGCFWVLKLDKTHSNPIPQELKTFSLDKFNEAVKFYSEIH